MIPSQCVPRAQSVEVRVNRATRGVALIATGCTQGWRMCSIAPGNSMKHDAAATALMDDITSARLYEVRCFHATLLLMFVVVGFAMQTCSVDVLEAGWCHAHLVHVAEERPEGYIAGHL